MSIVQSPCNSIQNACYAVLCHAAPEKRIALKGAEGIILDFGVRGGRALADEVEVHVGAERRRVEQDQPDVDAQFGL